MILALNSATVSTEIALLQNNQIVFEKSWPSNRDEAEKILPAIETALRKLQVGFENIETVYVVNGPGSFSALRIGVTIANTIAFARKIPMGAVGTFDLLRYKVTAEKRAKTALLIHGGLNFAVLFPDKEKAIQIEPEKLLEVLLQQNTQYICCDLNKLNTEKLIQALAKNETIQILKPQDLISFGTAILEISKTSLVQPQETITPLYLEKPHITQSKKQIYT